MILLGLATVTCLGISASTAVLSLLSSATASISAPSWVRMSGHDVQGMTTIVVSTAVSSEC